MYPDLSYFFHDLFGTAPDNWTAIVKTFGLLLALSFLTSAYFLFLELRRKQHLFSPMPSRNEKGEIVMMYPHERVGDITIVAAISGIIGAKLFAVIESADTLRGFLADPIHSLLSGSGLAIYGGLIFGFLAVYWFITKKLKMNPLYMMDAVAPALIFGYAMGRVGCQLSGDGDWGILNENPLPSWWFLPDWLWAYDYPRNVMNAGEILPNAVGMFNHHLVPKVYPTPIYETIMGTLIGIFLWIIRKKVEKWSGMLFMIYAVLNGIERFMIEKIRVNDKLWLDLTQAEIIAILLIIGGTIGAIILLLRPQKEQIDSSK